MSWMQWHRRALPWVVLVAVGQGPVRGSVRGSARGVVAAGSAACTRLRAVWVLGVPWVGAAPGPALEGPSSWGPLYVRVPQIYPRNFLPLSLSTAVSLPCALRPC
jgi:hypothetical protein